MAKVYIRMDPLLDQRKAHYSPAQLGAFVKVWLLFGRGKHAGRFRGTVADLKRALPRAFSRHVDFLVDQGDIIVESDPLYFDGWDEWQEGDLTVQERTAKLRQRSAERANSGTETGPLTAHSAVGVGFPPRAKIWPADQTATPQNTRGKRENYGDCTVTFPPSHVCGESGKCNALTLTPTLTVGDVPDISGTRTSHSVPTPPDPGDVRDRPDRPIPEDPLAALLLSHGMFDQHPRPDLACEQAARRARVWGLGLEEAGELWDHLERTTDAPRAVLGWALKDAGKLKVARSKMAPPRSKRVPGGPGRELLGLLAMTFAMPKSTSRSPFGVDHV